MGFHALAHAILIKIDEVVKRTPLRLRAPAIGETRRGLAR